MELLSWIKDWEIESESKNSDLWMVLISAIAFPILRFLLDTFIYENLGKKFVISKAQPLSKLSEVEKEALLKTHVKFKESCWKSLYYLVSEVFALSITYQEPWFAQTVNFWKGPGSQTWPDQLIKGKLKLFYCFVGGFYTYSIFALIFWETRRKDFGVSMSHHITTLILVLLSYVMKFARVCSLVVALHDASDVFLELAKLCNYSKLEIGSTVFFVVFALTWLVLRLVYFPFWIIRSTSYEVLTVLDYQNVSNGPFLYYSFNTLLILLLYLHLYWWILIVRVIMKQINDRGVIEKDVRSDEDE